MFIPAVRAYHGTGYDEFQFGGMRELGLEYVHGLPSFTWETIEPRDDDWKWNWIEEQMAAVARHGLRAIPGILLPKDGLPWLARGDPWLAAEYEELAYELAAHCDSLPGWSGMVAVWGGSSDVFGQHPLHEPEVQVPFLNAAYGGLKRAAPSTIVVSFNMATTLGLPDEAWADWHERAFALAPRFDWFGVQTHHFPATYQASPTSYGGVLGLVNVRRFLDEHGHADKPIFVNEGGILFGDDVGGVEEARQAEQVVETFVVARTLDIGLAGWVYFDYFARTHLPEDFGLMTPLDESDPPRPRQAWRALQVLVGSVRFFEHCFDTRVSGEYSRARPPFVYRFVHPGRPGARLWVVFSPWVPHEEPVEEEVTIGIAPAAAAVLIRMLGEESTLVADGAGNVRLMSTSAPAYVKVGE